MEGQSTGKKLQKCEGQALFEFLAFFPFMMIFYSITLTISTAINGSINQQKITRGYYFNLAHNDSNLPTVDVLMEMKNSKGLRSIGMFAIGWRFKDEGQVPLAPCYKILSLSAETATEECNAANTGEGTTQFIRVKTVFGICTATYYLGNNFYLQANNINGLPPSATYGSCMNM